MLKKNISKIKWHAAWLLLPILLFCNPLFASSNGEKWLDQPVSLKFHEEPRDKVLKKIASQTGIAILYDEELAGGQVSGNFHEVKAIEAITRLFAGKNKSIQVNKEKKVITVKTFGTKNFIWVGTDIGALANADDSMSSLEDASQLIAKKSEELAEKYQKYISDPNAIDPLTGKKLTNIRLQKEQVERDYKEYINNPDSVDPLTGKRLTTIALERKKYVEIYQNYINDPDAIDPLTGMTRLQMINLN